METTCWPMQPDLVPHGGEFRGWKVGVASWRMRSTLSCRSLNRACEARLNKLDHYRKRAQYSPARTHQVIAVPQPALTRLPDSEGVRHVVYQPRRVSGLLLLLAVVLNLGGVVMYSADTEHAWVGEASTYYAWERALFMSSYVAAALGAARTGASAG